MVNYSHVVILPRFSQKIIPLLLSHAFVSFKIFTELYWDMVILPKIFLQHEKTMLFFFASKDMHLQDPTDYEYGV